MDTNPLKREVLGVCQMLPRLGLVSGTSGNASARDPKTGLIGLKPSGVPYEEMRIEDIIITRDSGEIVEKQSHRIPTKESPTHLLIYRTFDSVHGIVHTHSKYANVLGCVLDEIPAGVTPTSLRLLEKAVSVIGFISSGTHEMAEAVSKKLTEGVAVVIRNHGPFIVGRTVKHALERAMALEDASEVYYKASLLGRPTLIE